MGKNLQILHEDEALIVVNKPPGLLSIPDRHKPELPNLYGLLGQRYGKIWVVHRLDRETSGLLCFARSAQAHRHLSLQFEHRVVEKTYLALVDGRPAPPAGDLEYPIAPHPRQSGKMVVNRHGKPARSTFRTIDTFRRFALLEVDLHTGRTHQIRVHLAQLGCPLAVDPLYGAREQLFLSEIKGRAYRIGRSGVERPLLDRLSLHAFRLGLQHPLSEQRRTFEAPPPKDLAACLNQLGKWDKE